MPMRHRRRGATRSPAVDHRGAAAVAGRSARRLLGLRRRQVEHRLVGCAGERVGGAHQGQPRRSRGAADSHARLGLVQRLVHGVHRRQRQRGASRRTAASPRLPSGVPRLAGHRPRAQPQRTSRPFLHAPVRDPTGNGREHRGPQADVEFAKGSEAGSTSDEYVRDTVFLATVLFLVGISSHFPVRQARYGLIGVGALILVFAVVQLLGLPGPPGGL